MSDIDEHGEFLVDEECEDCGWADCEGDCIDEERPIETVDTGGLT